MSEMVVKRGRWYPVMPPLLPGESDVAYTDRLTGASGPELIPYDHRRFRQCSIGYHDECSDPEGENCECPCHTTRTPHPRHDDPQLFAVIQPGAAPGDPWTVLHGVAFLDGTAVTRRMLDGVLSVYQDVGLVQRYAQESHGEFVWIEEEA